MNPGYSITINKMFCWKVQEVEEGQKELGSSKTLRNGRGLELQHVWERLRTGRSGEELSSHQSAPTADKGYAGMTMTIKWMIGRSWN